jgi:hypothetical protein
LFSSSCIFSFLPTIPLTRPLHLVPTLLVAGF